MKPGDRVMVVSSYSGRLRVEDDKVKAVHKNGITILERSSVKFRANGSAILKHTGWGSLPKLQPWDDALWEKFQAQESMVTMANSLRKLSEKFAAFGRDNEKASAIWESLPLSIREMVDDK